MRRHQGARRVLALLTSVLVCAGVSACADTSRRTSSATLTSSDAAAATGGIPTKATQTRQPRFGEYDEDDPSNAYYKDGDKDDAKPTDRDNDADNNSNSYFDGDDRSVRAFGHPAGASDRVAIAALVKGYYAAAARQDGAKACSLIYSALANTLPDDLGQAGPAYLRGTRTCARVMTKMFKHNDVQITAYAARLQVAGVRLAGDHGLVVLGFKTLPGRQIEVRREHSVWKIYAVVDQELP